MAEKGLRGIWPSTLTNSAERKNWDTTGKFLLRRRDGGCRCNPVFLDELLDFLRRQRAISDEELVDFTAELRARRLRPAADPEIMVVAFVEPPTLDRMPAAGAFEAAINVLLHLKFLREVPALILIRILV